MDKVTFVIRREEGLVKLQEWKEGKAGIIVAGRLDKNTQGEINSLKSILREHLDKTHPREIFNKELRPKEKFEGDPNVILAFVPDPEYVPKPKPRNAWDYELTDDQIWEIQRNNVPIAKLSEKFEIPGYVVKWYKKNKGLRLAELMKSDLFIEDVCRAHDERFDKLTDDKKEVAKENCRGLTNAIVSMLERR